MKTINITSNELQIFTDPKTNEYSGFAGIVQLYDSKIYVDTRTGKGYDKVIAKLGKFIKYLSSKYNFSGLSIDDVRQNIALYILEGIVKYDPRKNTKLSTFLQMRIDRRLINEIRNQGRDIRNPTILRTTLYSIVCKCGDKFVLSINNDDDIRDSLCKVCGNVLKNAKVYVINHPPQTLDSNMLLQKLEVDRGRPVNIDDVLSPNSYDIPMVYGKKPDLEEEIDEKRSIAKLLESEEPKTRKLLELICFDDHSIKSAAKEVGMSHTHANNKIRRLKNKQHVKEMLEK